MKLPKRRESNGQTAKSQIPTGSKSSNPGAAVFRIPEHVHAETPIPSQFPLIDLFRSLTVEPQGQPPEQRLSALRPVRSVAVRGCTCR